MKRTWMMITLAVVTTATAAMAENITAKIPFDFSVGGQKMEAGSYSVTRVTGHSYMLQLSNNATRKAVVLNARTPIDRKANDASRLVFSCRAGNCSVAEVYLPGESKGHDFFTPSSKSQDKERRVAVMFTNAGTSSGF